MSVAALLAAGAGPAVAAAVRMPTPETVRQAEAYLFELPQVDLQTQQLVHGGICARWILIPAGCHLTGAQTNCDNVCVMVGDITVTTDEGPRRLTGFNVLPAKAGAKRYGVAHADTYWLTAHHTDHTDPQAIEDEMTDEADRLQARHFVLQATKIEAIA